MKKNKLTSAFLLECLRQARYYEFCREPEKAFDALHAIWGDMETEPDIENLSHDESRQALLIAGSVLSLSGTMNQLKNYGTRAIDMLTRSREIAVAIGSRDGAAESEKQIGVAYWRLGEFENAVAYLNTALDRYTEAERLTNHICLFTQSNLLWLLVKIGQRETAFEMIDRLKPFIDEQLDLWIKTLFYNMSAKVFLTVENYNQAIPFLEKFVEYATRTKNENYLAMGLNNLSNAHLRAGSPNKAKAISYVDEAIKLFLAKNQLHPYAIALETKSMLTLDGGDPHKALLLINESIEILKKGENFHELCESLWTRTRIYVSQGELNLALKQLFDLLTVARQNLSLLEADRFISEYNRLVYIPHGDNLEEKERNFRRYLFDEALRACGGIVTTTAKRLGVMHQTFSAMIRKFPELIEKHQVKLRNRSVAALSKKYVPQKNTAGKIFALKLQTERLKPFGLKEGMIVNFELQPLHRLDLSKPIVICDSHGDYHCGFLIDAFGMFAFEFERGLPERTFMPEEILQTGSIIEICDPASGETTPFEMPDAS